MFPVHPPIVLPSFSPSFSSSSFRWTFSCLVLLFLSLVLTSHWWLMSCMRKKQMKLLPPPPAVMSCDVNIAYLASSFLRHRLFLHFMQSNERHDPCSCLFAFLCLKFFSSVVSMWLLAFSVYLVAFNIWYTFTPFLSRMTLMTWKRRISFYLFSLCPRISKWEQEQEHQEGAGDNQDNE